MNKNKTPIQTNSPINGQFWLVLIAIALLAVNMRSPIVLLGSLAPLIQEALGITAQQVGWLGALPMLMFALGAFISPSVGRRFGVENTLIAMLALMTLGMVVRSLLPTWIGFLSGTLLLSLAIGFANTLAAPVIKQHTPNHIALLTGIFSLTMTVMAGVSAGVALPLSAKIGWQWALGIWAIFGLLACWAWLILRLRLRSDQSAHHATKTDLKHMDNNTHFPKNAPENFSENPFENSSENPSKKSIWQSPLAWQIAIFLGLQSLLFYTIASFLPSIWISKGLDEIRAGEMGAIFQFMAPISIISLTYWVRRGHSIQKMAVAGTFFNTLGVAGMLFFSAKTAVWWTALMGLGCSIVFTLAIMLFSLRTHNASQASALSGMAQTVGYGLAFFGPLGAGWLYERTGGWQMPLSVLLALMLINLIVGYFASRDQMID